MKTSLTTAVAVLSLAFGFAAQADCAFPKAPDAIPDGKTASEAEMVSAMNAFKAYNEEVTAFGNCLDDEVNAKAGSAQMMQLKTMKTKKLNAAVEELQAKAKLFNEQVRIFKARG
ncbi:hypothetical protein HNQ60_002464 [Povalibacter uvarum]|uniref:Uncharacterized protein n=1 Tax=Povalibacter uvarum TaxID=732238 RepID=A0A841HLG1_9GAMM|nr:hypothetical protein [Povalibacter uvarum]MBB6093583.1 hypothetical protein [Povalibacter uvarum]